MILLEIAGKNIAGSGYNIFDWMAVGAAKRLEEIALIPVIGNSTYTSGGIKIAGGLVADYMRPKSGIIGKVSEYAVAGLIVDGVEDIMVNLLGPNPLGSLMGQGTSDGTQYV